jgi:hypothetical protein
MPRAFVRNAGHALYRTESNRPGAARTARVGFAPPEGCARFSLRQLPTAYSFRSSNLVQQRRQPIRFLNPRIELPILLRQIVRLPLDPCDTHRTDELHLRPCHAALRR